jgi:ligand-binding sensor domain-containing protein
MTMGWVLYSSRVLPAAIVLVGLIVARGGWALDPLRPIEQYPIETWSTDEGIPQSSVQALLQSSDGYLWIGTQEGLARFNGISFSTLDRWTRLPFENRYVNTLLQDHHGNIWIGTEGGLVRMSETEVRTLTSAQGLAGDAVNDLLEDRDGTIWIATDGGLSRIMAGSTESYTTADGLPHSRISSLAEDPAGRLWIGTEGGGVCVLEERRCTVLTARDGLADDDVRVIYVDRGGSTWIGTRSGLNRWHDGRFETFTAADGLASSAIWTVLEDRQGRLWIGTDSGLSRREEVGFSSLTKADGLADHLVWSLLEDHEGNLWVGTASGGLNRLHDPKLVTFGSRDGLTEEFIWTVLEDDQGAIWLGTGGGGLNRIAGSRVTVLSTRDGLADNNIFSLYQDRSGTLWVGARNGGLSCVRGGRVIPCAVPDMALRRAVRAILQDRHGMLWLGTSGDGLWRHDGTAWRAFYVEDGLPSNNVRCLHEDAGGDLWLGTSGGISCLSKGVFQNLDELPGRTVLAIYEDREGTLWFGTSRGLVRLRAGHLTTYAAVPGLYNGWVYQILEDSSNHLWISSNLGIFRVKKRELEEVAAGLREDVESVAFGKADGMASRECNGGAQPAGWRADDGRLWFPTVAGVAVIDPARIPRNQVPPPVMIEGVVVDGEHYDLLQPLVCPAGSKRFERACNALSFIAPQRLRFQFRLEPYDDDWVETVGRRVAYYTRIPPGRYRFRVRAANSDGVWSRQEAALELQVRPYFYQTFWFIGACVVVLGGAVWAACSLRLRQIKMRYRAVLAERQRMARELHDTLAQELTALSLQLEGIDETMLDDPQAAQRHLECARGIVRSSLAEARRTVWNLRSQVLEGASLDQALAQIAEQLTAGTAITISLEVVGHCPGLAKELEGQLLRIGQEAITNAVRHSACRNLDILLVFEPGVVSLRITDDGCGFDLQSCAHGSDSFGLRGMSERATACGGRLEMTSSGNGTVIEVVVPAGVERDTKTKAPALLPFAGQRRREICAP